MANRLRRLANIWTRDPVFFVTTCTQNRRRILDNTTAVSLLRKEWKTARQRHGWAVGRYVVMPDHVHFFCRPDNQAKKLAEFLQAWKEWSSKRLIQQLGVSGPIWQEGFFDHLLRNYESYHQKWLYVWNNPIRAGLAKQPEDWPWQGEIMTLNLQ